MEQTLLEAAKQIPALVVLAVVVRWFLNHMKESRALHIQHETERDERMLETLSKLGDSCHLVQRDSIAVMNELREELGRTREMHQQIIVLLQKQSA